METTYVLLIVILISITIGFVLERKVKITNKKLKEETKSNLEESKLEKETKSDLEESKLEEETKSDLEEELWQKEVEEETKRKNQEEKEESLILKYKEFDSTRAKDEFDMDDEEIKEFLQELKSQIEQEIPLIEEQINSNDLKSLKDSIHKIKGSAVNLGTNGVASLLYDFNHYLSEDGEDLKEIEKYYKSLLYYKEYIYKV